jgi:hypothetical protein
MVMLLNGDYDRVRRAPQEVVFADPRAANNCTQMAGVTWKANHHPSPAHDREC